MTLVSGLPWLVAGAALGTAYLYLIRKSVAAVRDGGSWRAAALPLGLRMVLAVSAFFLASQHGALPLLSMLVGFLGARSIALRRVWKG